MSIAAELNLTLPGLLAHLERDAQGWFASWRALTMRSVFQPVLSVSHQRVIGYEALLRTHDSTGVPVTPEALFAAARTSADARALDRLTRCLHVANFVEQRIDTGWLFLNARPQVFETGWPNPSFIDELSDHFGLPHERMVIEVLEQAADDEAAVASMLGAGSPRDFLVAIDDFGTGLSNFDRVWRFSPDIVKLDRSLVVQAAGRARRALVSHLVAMLHEAGTMVLAEGVENEDALLPLIEAGVDFVQGFWFGKPQPSMRSAQAAMEARVPTMWQKFDARQQADAPREHPATGEFAAVLSEGAQRFVVTGELAQAAQPLFRIDATRRVFVTDAQGEQLAPAIQAPSLQAPSPRLAPLFPGPDTRNRWSRNDWFQQALAAPGEVALKGPYSTPLDGDGCYTGALALERDGATLVFCADFRPGQSPMA